MEKMGHKVFGASSPWRGRATGSLGFRPRVLGGDLPQCLEAVLPHGILLGLSLAAFSGFPWPCQTEEQL